jgi:hypothetical protein
MCRRFRFAALLLILCVAVGCAPAAPQIVVMPTRAVLPSETPTLAGTPTPSQTFTPRPTLTPTENVLETQVALLNVTLNAFLTQNALHTQSAPTTTQPVPTSTPNVSQVPSPTITNTLPPGDVPPQVTPVLAQAVYVTSTANLRECASRECTQVLQVEAGNALLVTGTMEGEAINAGNSAWYQIDYFGQTLFVYSDLVSVNPPTLPPPTSAPLVIVPPTPAQADFPPVSLPEGGGSCPSTSATCGQLNCEQAHACLAAGNGRLDADDDGIPCESVCLGD